MLADGWFPSWRKTWRSWINQLPVGQRWVIETIFAEVAISPTRREFGGRIYDLAPGQHVTSSRKLAEVANVSRKVVDGALAELRQHPDFARVESTPGGTMISLCKYDAYGRGGSLRGPLVNGGAEVTAEVAPSGGHSSEGVAPQGAAGGSSGGHTHKDQEKEGEGKKTVSRSKPKAPSKPKPPPLPFTLAELCAALKSASNGWVLTEPFDRRLAPPLTAAIRSIQPPPTIADIEAVGRWAKTGLSWMRERPTLNYFAKAGMLADAIAKARSATPRVAADELKPWRNL